jgi:DNA-binding XRE family transcriptional regulator
MLKPSLKGVKKKMDKKMDQINKEIKKSVGKRLKEFWQHLGKGQEEFAKIIGITNISVSNIDDLVKSPEFSFSVIPAKAGIQPFQWVLCPAYAGMTTFYAVIKH